MYTIFIAIFCNNINYTAISFTAIQNSSATLNYFNFFYSIQIHHIQMARIIKACRHSINEDKSSSLYSTQAQRTISCNPALVMRAHLRKKYARLILQCVSNIACASFLQFLTRINSYIGRCFQIRFFITQSSNIHARQAVFL